MDGRPADGDRLEPAAIEHYRREGSVLLRGLLARDPVAASIDGLMALAADPALAPGSVPGEAPYHDAAGDYAGCTVSKRAPLDDSFSYTPRRQRPVVPLDRLPIRHCEERSDEAIQESRERSRRATPGLLRFARNDDWC
jgi:hypothetical protein